MGFFVVFYLIFVVFLRRMNEKNKIIEQLKNMKCLHAVNDKYFSCSPRNYVLIVDNSTVPGNPQDVKVTPINSTTIKVEWKPPHPKERNGIILGYHVHVQETKEEV